MSFFLWTLAIAAVTAIACSLCGTYLVVKAESLVSEALSHAVLPGIIIAFLIFEDRSSPWLIISAGLMGLLMIWLVELIKKTRLVDADAALGIVFSSLFSIGIILATRNFRKTHFDADCIIDGNLATAALMTTSIGDTELAPTSFLVMLAILVLVVGFIFLFYKELKLTMFDKTLAKGLGFKPDAIHLCWLGIVSITTVAAFDIAGSVLVVALMIAPPAAAFLFTKRLSLMLILSAIIGLLSAVGGVYLGYHLDISPTGPIAATAGLFFLVTIIVAPQQGLMAQIFRRRKTRSSLFQELLVTQLATGTTKRASLDDLSNDYVWTQAQLERTIRSCVQEHWISLDGNAITLTDSGRAKAEAGEQQIR